MSEIIKNVLRRKVRSFLTILGIVIGVFAIAVMGSMSEYFNQMLENAMKMAGTNIEVVPADRSAESQFNQSTVRTLERVRGVREVIVTVADTLDEMGSVQMGMPSLVIGVNPWQARASLPTVTLSKGRWLERGDSYHAVIGSQTATQKRLDLGSRIVWREKEFTVVGVLNSTNTTPDQMVIVPLETARRTMKAPNLISGLSVVPDDRTEIDVLIRRINREVPRVKARSVEEIIDEVKQGLLIFNVIMLSSALLAAIVGGLSVVNTMIMSVNERVREIGIKKAVGATDRDIMAEYVGEAAAIGAIGGVIGLSLGWLMTLFLNAAVAQALGGTELWVLTPRLALICVGFASGLGAFAGLYPAWQASRLDPVRALRSE